MCTLVCKACAHLYAWHVFFHWNLLKTRFQLLPRAGNPNELESQPPTRMNCLKHGNMSGALRAPLGSFVSQLLAQWLAQECTIKFAQIFVDSSLPRILMTPLAAKPRHMAKRADFEMIWCIFPIKSFWITQTINFPMVSSACPTKVSN